MTSRRRRIAARRRNKDRGSPYPGEPDFLVVGRLQRPHGLRGELLMAVLTDFPERLQPQVTLYLGEERQPVRVRSTRRHNKGLLIAFEGFESREQVDFLRNRQVFVRADDRPSLPPGEFYHHQLLGLQVVTDEGRVLGRLAEILETGANDVFVVRPQEGADLLLPDTDEVLLAVDLEAGELRVRLIPGLLPGEE